MTAADLDRSSVIGDSTTAAFWTLLSRLTGFGRVLLIGAVLGPSYFGNLFQLANNLPWIIFELTIGPLLGAMLVPALVAVLARQSDGPDGGSGVAGVERLAGQFLGLVIAVFTAVTVLIMLGSFGIIRLLAAPIGDDAVRADFIAVGLPLLLLTAPQTIGYGVTVAAQAVQHAFGRFALPAAASMVENVVVITTLALFALRYGTGLEIDEVGLGPVLLLGVGSGLGVVAHAVLQLIGVRRTGIRLVPRRGWTGPAMRSLIGQAWTSSGTALVNGLRFLVLIVSANTVAGGVVAVQLAINLLNLPVALAAKPVSFATLPRMAAAWARGEIGAVVDIYRRGIGLAALVVVPAAFATAGLGWFAAGGLALGEMASDDGRRLVAFAIIGVGGAVVGESLFQLATAAAYAKQDAPGPLVAQSVRVGVTAAGIAGGLVLVDGVVVILWFALAMSVADLVASVLLHRRVVATWPAPDGFGRSLARTVGSSAVAVGVAAILAHLIDARWPEPRAVGLTIGVSGALGLGVLGGFVALRSRFDGELQSLVGELRGRATADPELGEDPALVAGGRVGRSTEPGAGAMS